MIAKYYRMNLSFEDALSVPMGFLHYLYFAAVQESKDAAATAARTREAIEDEVNGG